MGQGSKMTEAWSVRIKRLRFAMGWPYPLVAIKLGIGETALRRLRNGGRPKIEVLLRLQELEKRHAVEIEKQRRVPYRRVKEAYLWPPSWVECKQRWWVEIGESKPASRPPDLQALGETRTDDATILTGRLDPRNFKGRALRVVDWTLAGRTRYAEDMLEKLRLRESRQKRSRKATRPNFKGATWKKKPNPTETPASNNSPE
jgi:transcriptional regulator with XRE-family HTH domain